MARLFYFPAEALKTYMLRYFQRWQVPEADAAIAAEILLSADMRGVDSHGIIRLNTYYGVRLRKGILNPHTILSTLRETPTSLALDGGNGLGMVVGYHAMQRTIEKARTSGIAMTTVRGSNHFGIAGYYAMMALPEEMIGICFTNSQPLVAPTFGRTAILGTNPIAVAVPSGKERPYVLDMATSIVPVGRITVYQKANKPIPAGWGVDDTGAVTEDPSRVLQGGALLPLGGTAEMRGYKGYGLSLLVDIFSGVLSGASFGSSAGHRGKDLPSDIGHFFGAMRIDCFRPADEFKQDMDAYIHELKSAPKAAGEERIYIHGEKEFERSDAALREGVPLMEAVVSHLRAAGEQDEVPFDLVPLKIEENSD